MSLHLPDTSAEHHFVSQNQSPRKLPYWSCIVIHHITVPYIAPIQDVLIMDKKTEFEYFKEICLFLGRARTHASAHYVIGRYGEVGRVVDPNTHRAWHAGKSYWWNEIERDWQYNVNNFGIGVELIGDGNFCSFTDKQYTSLEMLVRRLIINLNMPSINCLVGHELISNKKVRDDFKIDPGKFFNWDRIYNDLYNSFRNLDRFLSFTQNLIIKDGN